MVRQQVREMGGKDFVLFTGVDEYLWKSDGRYIYPSGMHNSMAIIPGDFDSITTTAKQHLMPFGEYLPFVEHLEWLGNIYTALTGTQVGEGIRPGKGDEPIAVPMPLSVILSLCLYISLFSSLRLCVSDYLCMCTCMGVCMCVCA